MARCRRQKHHRRRPSDDQGRSKFSNYKNLCLRDQAKPLEKHLFAVRSSLLRRHCALFFPTITRNGFCSHLRKIISRQPLTPPKNRDIHIVEFFLYSKTIDIIRKKILIFYFEVEGLCKPGNPDNGVMLQVAF